MEIVRKYFVIVENLDLERETEIEILNVEPIVIYIVKEIYIMIKRSCTRSSKILQELIF